MKINKVELECGCIVITRIFKEFEPNMVKDVTICCLKHEKERIQRNAETRKLYEQSDHGKEIRKQYQQTEKCKETKQIWREINSDKIKEQKRKYKEENKEKLNETQICECGGSWSLKHKAKHERTNKHQNFLDASKI